MGIEVEIQTEQPPSHIYGPKDRISGTIVMKLSKDTSLRSIEVKLKAMETTVVQYWVFRNNRRERRTCSSQHQWYHKTWRVFPSNEVSAETSGKYTLPKGVHEYPFSVQFPEDPQIPGSISSLSQGFKVQHFVKVSVHRDSHWKMDKRLQLPKTYYPTAPTMLLDDPSRSSLRQQGLLVRKYENPKEGFSKVFSRSPRATANITVVLESPAHGLPQAPRPLRLRLHVSTDLEIAVTHLAVALTSLTVYFAIDPWGARQSTSETVLHPVMSTDLHLTGTEFELTDYVYNAVIKGILCPTFTSVYIKRTYGLEVTVTVADPQNLNRTQAIKVPVEKIVLPPLELRTGPSGAPLVSMDPEPVLGPPEDPPPDSPDLPGKSGEIPDFKNPDAPPAYNG